MKGFVTPERILRVLGEFILFPRKHAGCPRIRFHDLRHSAAALMLERGVPVKMVSEMLGHTSVGITLDLYAHVTPTMQRQAVAAIEAILGG